MAKPLSNQETAFSITAKDTNSHGTPNKTPSKTFLYSLISSQVCSASKKALHNSIYTLSILYSTPSFFSLFLPLLLSFFELKYLAVTTMAYHRVPCNKLLIFLKKDKNQDCALSKGHMISCSIIHRVSHQLAYWNINTHPLFWYSSGFCRLFKSTISTDAVQNHDKNLPAYCLQQSSLNTISYSKWFYDDWTDPIADYSAFSNLIMKEFVVFSDFQASLLSEEPVMLHIWLQLEFHVAAVGQSYQAMIKQILCSFSDAQNVFPQTSMFITLRWYVDLE